MNRGMEPSPHPANSAPAQPPEGGGVDGSISACVSVARSVSPLEALVAQDPLTGGSPAVEPLVSVGVAVLAAPTLSTLP